MKNVHSYVHMTLLTATVFIAYKLGRKKALSSQLEKYAQLQESAPAKQKKQLTSTQLDED